MLLFSTSVKEEYLIPRSKPFLIADQERPDAINISYCFFRVEGVLMIGKPLVSNELTRWLGHTWLAQKKPYRRMQACSTLRLRQLINDVRKNTHYDEMLAETPKLAFPNQPLLWCLQEKRRVSSQNWKMTAITASPWEPCRKGSNLVISKPLICKDGLTTP